MFSLNPLLWLRYKQPDPKSRTRQRPPRCPFRPQIECLENRLAPATLHVTTHDDVVNARDGKLSLREAINLANAATQPDTIVLAAGTYPIASAPAVSDDNASGDFEITRSMTIEGQGAGITTVDAAGKDRIFDVLGTINVTFKNMSLIGGFVNEGDGGAIQAAAANLQVVNCQLSGNNALAGGAIYDQSGNVTLSGSTVSDNKARGEGGGGIFLGGGKLMLRHTTVQDNFVPSAGGGICGTGTVTLTDSTVSGNTCGTSGGGIAGGTVNLTGSTVSGNNTILGDGGGISASTAVNLVHSTVSGNSALTQGGGISTSGTATLSNCTVSGNSATAQGCQGGGIFAATATLSNCTVSSNSANGVDGLGGGIFAATATLSNCTVSGNFAVGPLANRGSSGGQGGGIFAATATLSNCTVSDNQAFTDGGGIETTGSATLTDSTVSGNFAEDSGGINALTATLTNSTVSGNSAASLGVGGILAGTVQFLNDTIAENTGGVVQSDPNLGFVKNTIIALNGVDVSGAFNSLGHNLIGIETGAASGFAAKLGDQIGSLQSPIVPGLSAFGNHGGTTQTYALLPGSPALHAGANDAMAGLSAAVNAITTRLTVSDTTQFGPGLLLRLGSEVVRVIKVNDLTNTLTVQRGVGGTKAAAHTRGAGLFLGGDQRGALRPRNGNVDIGAFEL